MEKIIGRANEQAKLNRILDSEEAEFVAVYGRRRVGKTYLVNQCFQSGTLFLEVTGQYKNSMKVQLHNFTRAVSRSFFSGAPIQEPANWIGAFELLQDILEKQTKKKKIVLFFDEVPWLATRRSGFLNALEYFFNTFVSRQAHIKLIVCGSAASWMIKNIVNSKGGLHNRITASIRLLPFTLGETTLYLQSRKIKLDKRQVMEIYMIMGGIPHYLKQIKKGFSVAQNIDDICFSKDGFLNREFHRLYDSLYENSAVYKKVITMLAKSKSGLQRMEITAFLKTTPGGKVSRILSNLKEAGFIEKSPSFGKLQKGSRYRLSDEYSRFYLAWIAGMDKTISDQNQSNYWKILNSSQKYAVWAGYAFEEICFKHIECIKKALGINGIISSAVSWNHIPSDKRGGAQVDLLFDRSDNVISLCEIKNHREKFVLNKKYCEMLKKKIKIFKNITKTRKSVFLVLISASGIKTNQYSNEIIDNTVVLEDLFR